MKRSQAQMSPWEEHHFWLEILEDHTYFLVDFLSSAETQWVEVALSYQTAFRTLRERVERLDPRLGVNAPEMIALSVEAQRVTSAYYQFEGHLQNLRILNRVILNRTPSYFNGTLDEAEEYLRRLSAYVQGQEPAELSLPALLQLWIIDQIGHAELLKDAFDPVELPLEAKTAEYQRGMQALWVKHGQMTKFLRFTPPGFPAQQQLVRDVAAAVIEFYQFVELITERYRNSTVLTDTTLRFLEHHFPESCYFLRKLSAFAPDLQIPECSLTKPSFKR
ncbi:hypothetical protein CBW65_18630 [Tumebacillus avium]|uniref:DUF2935 domain-containing protein n=1 Tax=Tumebacillus avium TaxID=1903704 RepID=A0A1Y0IRW6_9BACL|nr:DUF2935 domain-containing protein [Tumebacillus avium]ARU62759.1 hypothetical protein CBW65_18630 [Tumebacillus avium]